MILIPTARAGRQQQQESQQQEGANKSRETNKSRGAKRTLEAPLAEEINSSREATTAEAIFIADLQGRDNSCENTSTAGPTAAQETIGTAGELTTAGTPEPMETV